MVEQVRCKHCTELIPRDSSTCPICEHFIPPIDFPRIPLIRRKEVNGFTVISQLAVAVLAFFGNIFQLAVLTELLPGKSREYLSGYWLAGTGLICLAITIGVKLKGRHWAWGLLGFLGIAGCVIAQRLRHGCEGCGGLCGRTGVCPRCVRLL